MNKKWTHRSKKKYLYKLNVSKLMLKNYLLKVC
jgi:hypothetical protein